MALCAGSTKKPIQWNLYAQSCTLSLPPADGHGMYPERDLDVSGYITDSLGCSP